MARFLSIIALLVAFNQAYAGDPSVLPIDCIDLPTGCPTNGPGDPPAVPMPEPSTLALFGLGIVAVGLISRRRRK